MKFSLIGTLEFSGLHLVLCVHHFSTVLMITVCMCMYMLIISIHVIKSQRLFVVVWQL